MASGEVFINYRSEDTSSYGALLYTELSRRFGAESVFLDVESIPAGADYVEQLLGRVRQARVVLAVIGPRWLVAAGPGGGRRIDDPADWIRRELVEAFAAGVKVIPVLTDDAPMPIKAQLPEDLRALGRCQFRRLRHRDASADLARLVADLASMDDDLDIALKRGPYDHPEVVCPYPGMVAFGPDDAPFFRGRENAVATVLSRLAVQIRGGGGPLVVIGASGVGKSSLLRAGVLPALAAGDLPIEGSARWPCWYFRPGADPLAGLAARVKTLGIGEEDLPAAVRASPAALRRVLGRAVDPATQGESVGLQVEPALTELLVADASDEALPQLAHVLRRTFANRQGRIAPAPGTATTATPAPCAPAPNSNSPAAGSPTTPKTSTGSNVTSTRPASAPRRPAGNASGRAGSASSVDS